MNFQKLLSCYYLTKNAAFVELISTNEITPDTFLYKISTTQGEFYIFEIDGITNFKEDVIDYVNKLVNENISVLPVIERIKKFEDSGPVKACGYYRMIEDWDYMTTFANDKYGSRDYYFNFLFEIKGKKDWLQKILSRLTK